MKAQNEVDLLYADKS